MTDLALDVERLIRFEPVSPRPPWNDGDHDAVEAFLRDAVASIEERLHVSSRCVFDHYGSGTASFVDAWFFRREPAFRIAGGTHHTRRYRGLFVLLSRLTHHFVVGEGEKAWEEADGDAWSYLPRFELVDAFASDAVAALVPDVERVLGDLGMVRLRRGDLERPLPPGTDVPTLLPEVGGDSPLRLFDAVFYWSD